MAQYCKEVSKQVTFSYRPVVDTYPAPGYKGEKTEYGPETIGWKTIVNEVCVAGGRGPGETPEQLYLRMQEAFPKAIALWNNIPILHEKGRHNKVDTQVTYPLKGNDVVDDPETTNRCSFLDMVLGGCGAVADSSNDYRDPKKGQVFKLFDGPRNNTGFGWACFSGQMNVLLKDGGTMQLSQLAYLGDSGKELPAIASFDTEISKIVYQKPSRVITHSNASGLLYLGLGGGGAPLQVTGNHPMLVRRNGLEAFVPVEEIQSGDCLVSSFGECSQYQSGKTFMSQGTTTLYDISMPNIHNFLICTDDKCYIGHNKMF